MRSNLLDNGAYRLTITLPHDIGKFVKSLKRGERIQYITDLILQDQRRTKKKRVCENFLKRDFIDIKEDPVSLVRELRKERNKQLIESL